MVEDEVKRFLADWLLAHGWGVEQLALGRSPGIDLLAGREGVRWVIEAKGVTAAPRLDFQTMLGQITMLMDDAEARYSVALPEGDLYRRCWEAVPALARQRLGISALFVSSDGTVVEAS